MNDIPIGQIIWFRKTRSWTAVRFSLNVGTVSQTVRSGTGPCIKRHLPSDYRLGSRFPSHFPIGNLPCPSSSSHGFRHHTN
jgi:hypothetical protein